MEDQHVPQQVFSPSLWMQRRMHIRDLLATFKFSSVFEVGCGEGKVLAFFANNPNITRLGGVDLLEDRLLEAKAILEPRELDRTMLREKPLHIRLYKGSMCDASVDAVGEYEICICTEVIEHVPLADHEAFEAAIFTHGFEVVVFTTPNSEYNVLFHGLGDGFRDDDHKFEWTRQEFQQWADKVAIKYGYEVKFSGVGILKDSEYTNEIGFCTQSATFTKSKTCNQSERPRKTERSVELFAEIEYPYFDASKLSLDDIIKFIKQKILPNMDKEQKENLDANYLWSFFPIRQRCQGDFNRLMEVMRRLTPKH